MPRNTAHFHEENMLHRQLDCAMVMLDNADRLAYAILASEDVLNRGHWMHNAMVCVNERLYHEDIPFVAFEGQTLVRGLRIVRVDWGSEIMEA
jgi:hypothetical protein